MSNLVDNGDGTYQCKPGCECKVAGGGGGGGGRKPAPRASGGCGGGGGGDIMDIMASGANEFGFDEMMDMMLTCFQMKGTMKGMGGGMGGAMAGRMGKGGGGMCGGMGKGNNGPTGGKGDMMAMMKDMMGGGTSNAGAGKGMANVAPENLVCSVHGKKRSAQCLADNGWGQLTCLPGKECKGAAVGTGAAANGANGKEMQVCSVHGKNRTLMNLQDNGDGTYSCLAGMECKDGGGGGGVPSASVAGSGGFCSVHGKQRSAAVLMANGDGTFQCQAGKECRTGGSGAGVEPSATSDPGEQAYCAMHGKARSLKCLEERVGGVFVCKPGMECKGADSGAGRSQPYGS